MEVHLFGRVLKRNREKFKRTLAKVFSWQPLEVDGICKATWWIALKADTMVGRLVEGRLVHQTSSLSSALYSLYSSTHGGRLSLLPPPLKITNRKIK